MIKRAIIKLSKALDKVDACVSAVQREFDRRFYGISLKNAGLSAVAAKTNAQIKTVVKETPGSPVISCDRTERKDPRQTDRRGTRKGARGGGRKLRKMCKVRSVPERKCRDSESAAREEKRTR